MNTSVSMETPSGKAAADENFPVGSWLLPARLRPHIAAFYAYARTIDDIADNPSLAPDDKIARLQGFAEAVAGSGPPDLAEPVTSARTAQPAEAITTAGASETAFRAARALRRSLAETGVTPRHCVDLVRAFKQDAVKLRYDDWRELMAYCDLSAAPVGRYLVDLHGESAAAYPASDALCNALQVLNHLQDCGGDYRALNRIYLPLDWMAAAGAGVDALALKKASVPLRRVLDRCLDHTDRLLETADALPGRLRNLRFALEAAVIVAIAWRLSAELRRRDPLGERVVLTRVQYAACCARGIGRVLFERVCRRPNRASVLSQIKRREDARAFSSSARRDDEQWRIPREEEQRSRRRKGPADS